MFGTDLAPLLSMMRLAIKLCLSGRFQEALYVIAVVCSTWSSVNIATSQRDILTPYGNQNLPSVRSGNRMVARRDCSCKHKDFRHGVWIWGYIVSN